MFLRIIQCQLFDLDTGFFENFRASVSDTQSHNNFNYVRINQHFCTQDAWLVGTIDRRILYADTMNCRLDYGVLLGMDSAAQFMSCP